MRVSGRRIIALVFAAMLAIASPVAATHTSGYNNGEIKSQCYTYGFIYSKASNVVGHWWKNFGFTWWNNSQNTYRQNSIPTPSFWTVQWDHDHDYSGGQCNS